MTNQEAIADLETLLAYIPIYRRFYQSISMSIKALKQGDMPKTGYWIDTGSGQECSKCGEIQYGYDSYRYFCANCGCRMVETQERRE